MRAEIDVMVDFTFVPQQHPDGRSRRISNKTACTSCRSKKRRCQHRLSEHTPTPAQPRLNTQTHKRARKEYIETNQDDPSCATPPDQMSSHIAGVHSGRQQQLDQGETGIASPSADSQDDENHEAEHESGPHFVGDLNPAARLLDGTESPLEHKDPSPREVGVWVQPRLGSNTGAPTNPSNTTSTPHSQPAKGRRRPLASVIATEHIIALSNLYFANVHPILPLLNEQDYRDSLEQNRTPTALIHAVCLIAAKDGAAGPHLRLLDSSESTLSVRAFCAKLYVSVTSEARHFSTFRRITLIRILGLLSLHQEGSNGAEEASCHIAMACHHAQTLAIHLNRPGDEQNLEMKRTFWCLWTLDRLNAATNSRPCIFNAIDIAIDDPQPGELGSAAFDIWFRIATNLDRAIVLYRPTNPDTTTGIDLDYPGFEQLVDEMHGWHLSPPTLATLRIFFLSTAILSYRLKTIRILPATTMARLRQQVSAMQMIRQLQDTDCLESLHPLPVVVYGASLALSVSYQQLRYSRLALDQQEALHDFKTSCKILQKLQQKWSTADAMASLAQKVSLELEKVPNLSFIHLDKVQSNNGRVNQIGEDGGNVATLVPRQEDELVNETNYPFGSTDPTFNWDSEMHDIFEGMDDMSWMYLAAENPFRFDHMPDLDV